MDDNRAGYADFDDSMQLGPVGLHTLRLQTRYPVVAGSRLRLRPFTLVDISRLVSVVAANRVADVTLAVPRPLDALQARRWIESHPAEWRKRSALHWAVSGLDSDCLRGYVGLHDIQLEWGRANLSFWIADRLPRKELAIEAAQAAMAFAFTSLQLDSVQAHQLPGNPLVARVLRRLGLKPDTTVTPSICLWGRTEDALAWRISKSTWVRSLHDTTIHLSGSPTNHRVSAEAP